MADWTQGRRQGEGAHVTIQIHTAMNQVQLLNGDPIQVIWRHNVWRHRRSRKHYVNNFSQNRARAVGELLSCLSRQDASTDMQYDLLGHLSGQVIWPGLRSNFQLDLSESKCICFDASWRDEYDGVSRFLCISYFKSYLQKMDFQKNNFFSLTCPGKVKMT